MQKIIPCLWFNNEAEEAANFYTSIFKGGKIGKISRYDKASAEASGRPEGSALTVEFEIEDCTFTGLNGGSNFQINPSISFIISRETEEEINELWEKLSEGGKILIPLDSYPFSKRYGWVQDKYGVSWQLILPGMNGEPRPSLVPSMLFVNENFGRAEEAINLYTSVFKDAKVGAMFRYEADSTKPNKEGAVMYADFYLLGQWFAAMDAAMEHKFQFNEGVSLQVMCKSQEEVDHYWQNLTAGGGEESMCGWLKDKFGVSWQIVPTILPKILNNPDKEKSGRVMKAMLQMKKIDIEALEKAQNGE